MASANSLTVCPNRASETSVAIEIAQVADDPVAAYAKAVAVGAEGVKAPEAKPWGQWVG